MPLQGLHDPTGIFYGLWKKSPHNNAQVGYKVVLSPQHKQLIGGFVYFVAGI